MPQAKPPRKKNLLSRREQAAQFAAIAGISLDGFCLVAEDGRLLEVNEAYCQMTGYTQAELLEKTMMDLDAHETPEIVHAHMLRIIATGSDRFESQHYRKDGGVVDLEVSVTFVPETGCFLSFLKDISARIQAEKALRESELKFRTIFENSNDAIGVSKTGMHVFVNPAYLAMFGYSSESELVGRPIIDLIAPAERERILNNVRMRSIGEPAPSIYVTRGLRKDGSEFDQETRVSMYILGENLEERYTLVLLRDVTEFRRAEIELQRQNRTRAALQETMIELIAQRELGPLLEDIVARAGELTGTTAGFLDLVDPSSRRLKPMVARGALFQSASVEANPGEGVAGVVWQSGKPLVINHYDEWPLRISQINLGQVSAVIGVPLLSGEQVLGVLGLGYESGIERGFDSETVDLLGQFARLAVIAIQNTRLFSALQQELGVRKRAENALRKSTEELNSFFSVTLDLLCIADTSGHFRMLNPAWETTLGYSAAEMMQGRFLDFVHPEDVAATETVLMDLADQKDVLSFTNRYRCKGGGYRWLEWRSHPMGVLIYAAARDVTEHKQAEEDLAREAARSAAVLRVAGRLNAQLDPSAVLSAVCEETARALNVRTVTVTLYNLNMTQGIFIDGYGVPALYRERVAPWDLTRFAEYLRQMNGPARITAEQLFVGTPNASLASALKIKMVQLARMAYAGEIFGTLNVFVYEDEPAMDANQQALLQGLADQASQALANARLFEASERRLRYTQSFHEIDAAILGSMDLNFILNMVLEQAISQLRLDAADILLLNGQSQTLEFAAGRGFRGRSGDRLRLAVGQGFAGRVALECKPVHITDLTENSSIQGKLPFHSGEGFVSYYGLPLIARGMLTGVLEIFSRTPLQITGEWQNLLETLSAHAAIAIDSNNLFKGLRRSSIELTLAFDATLDRWAQALDLHEYGLPGHARRVTELAIRLARALNFKDADIVHLRRGALLHDVGVMGIADAVLTKPGPLTDDERQMVRRHPVLAHDWLSSIEFLRPALDIPYAHHEKWDGTGYPRGLSGEQIPRAARIFAVVDVWDALISVRPYRPAWTYSAAQAYLREQRGVHFDPHIVDVFLSFSL